MRGEHDLEAPAASSLVKGQLGGLGVGGVPRAGPHQIHGGHGGSTVRDAGVGGDHVLPLHLIPVGSDAHALMHCQHAYQLVGDGDLLYVMKG